MVLICYWRQSALRLCAHIDRFYDAYREYGVGQRILEGRIVQFFCLGKDLGVTNSWFMSEEKRNVAFKLGENVKKLFSCSKEKNTSGFYRIWWQCYGGSSYSGYKYEENKESIKKGPYCDKKVNHDERCEDQDIIWRINIQISWCWHSKCVSMLYVWSFMGMWSGALDDVGKGKHRRLMVLKLGGEGGEVQWKKDAHKVVPRKSTEKYRNMHDNIKNNAKKVALLSMGVMTEEGLLSYKLFK